VDGQRLCEHVRRERDEWRELKVGGGSGKGVERDLEAVQVLSGGGRSLDLATMPQGRGRPGDIYSCRIGTKKEIKWKESVLPCDNGLKHGLIGILIKLLETQLET
jgi:hypothetical protein